MSNSLKLVSSSSRFTPSDTQEVLDRAILQVRDLLYTKSISHTELHTQVIEVLKALVPHRVSLVLNFKKPNSISTGDDCEWLESPDTKVVVFNLMRESLGKESFRSEFSDILRRFSVAMKLYPVNQEQLADLDYVE